jgi:hypothetical protein
LALHSHNPTLCAQVIAKYRQKSSRNFERGIEPLAGAIVWWAGVQAAAPFADCGGERN